jgi:two-component system sensor histidine kinase RegB
VVGQLATVLVVDRVMHIHLPLRELLAIIAIEAASNVGCALWLRRRSAVPESAEGIVLVADVLILTGLLYLSGGPYNPFSFLYLVHIALAAVVLRERWTWALALLSLGCFGALFLLPVRSTVDHSDPSMHGAHLQMHLEGMWVAFGVAAGFIVYFVQRVTRALAEREEELREARTVRERNEKFASLVTLAAGAAHELATPLSTIAVVSKELGRRLDAAPTPEAVADARDDAQLIRSQVERCRQILSQMTADAGESMGEPASVIGLGELVAAAVRGCVDPDRVSVASDATCSGRTLRGPREALVRALSNVINNAIQASPHGDPVVVQAACDRSGLHLQVRDSGTGMTDDVARRVGEPFFTTKAPGEGMGLGLYLTRAVVSRLGGRLTLQSNAGAGTTVELTLPAELLGQAGNTSGVRE